MEIALSALIQTRSTDDAARLAALRPTMPVRNEEPFAWRERQGAPGLLMQAQTQVRSSKPAVSLIFETTPRCRHHGDIQIKPKGYSRIQSKWTSIKLLFNLRLSPTPLVWITKWKVSRR